MQFSIPTNKGDIHFSPYLDRTILKESLKILIKTENRNSIRLGVVYSCIYPKLFTRFRR